MVPQSQDCREDALLLVLALIDKIDLPDKQQKITAGRKQHYSDRLFVKAAVIMTMKRLNKVYELLTVVNEPTRTMQTLRTHLTLREKMPTRRTFEPRLTALSERLPQWIAHLGAFLVRLLDAWQETGRAVAQDSTVGYPCSAWVVPRTTRSGTTHMPWVPGIRKPGKSRTRESIRRQVGQNQAGTTHVSWVPGYTDGNCTSPRRLGTSGFLFQRV